MLSLKLVRSLVLGNTANNPILHNHPPHSHDHNDTDDSDVDGDDSHAHKTHTQLPRDDVDDAHLPPTTTRRRRTRGRRRRKREGARIPRSRTPLLLFVPTRELITDTYRLATIARDIGMDLYPNASLSHLIFSWSSPSSSSSASSSFPSPHPFSSSPSPSPSYRQSFSSSSRPSCSSSSTATMASSSWALPNDAVPLPFPSLSTASISLLRYFVSISKGFFKLVYLDCKIQADFDPNGKFSTWDCSSLSLVSRISGTRIETMDCFCRVLAGHGWTLFKTRDKPNPDPNDSQLYGSQSVYLFRKVDAGRIRTRESNGQSRIKELRLPPLDFNNVPLRILQYIILMTDDIFNLA